MNKSQLLDKIAPCLTNNPRLEISDKCSDAESWESNFHYLLGGLIAEYENRPDALHKIKNDLTSLTFAANSIITNAR